MPQSIFLAVGKCSLDFIAPTLTHPDNGDVGVYLTGGSKAILRRSLATFNLYGAASEGRALKPTDTILLAELIADAEAISGPAFGVNIERVTRSDYNQDQATWSEYKTGSAWTAGGGDVATPPAVVSFTSPATTGDQVINNQLLGFVTDAIANRAGLVIIRCMAQNENPGVTALYTLVANAGYVPAIRLRVTYADPTPTPIDDPQGGTLGSERAATPERAAPRGRPTPPARPARPNHQSPITRRLTP